MLSLVWPLALALTASLLWAANSAAVTRVVTKDPPPYDPLEYGSIEEAVDAAVDGDVVLIEDGVYKGPFGELTNGAGAGWGIFVGAGTNITIRSQNGPEHTIIDLDYSGRAFMFQNNSTTVQGLTIRNGLAPGSDGGAIHAMWGSLVVEDCIFEGNQASTHGGAIAIFYSDPSEGRFEISDSRFSRNSSYRGGAVGVMKYDSGYHMDYCVPDPTDTQSLIESNTFDGNVARYGGAIYDQGFAAVLGSTFRRNQGLLSGGAISTANGRITNSVFLKNSSVRQGGAIVARVCETALSSQGTILAHSTLVANQALDGGGALHAQQSVAVQNSILWGNTAQGNGSQIHVAPGRLYYDQTTAATDGRYMSVADALLYGVGDLIELNEDGVARRIYFINSTTGAIWFVPALSQLRQNAPVYRWPADEASLFRLEIGDSDVEGGLSAIEVWGDYFSVTQLGRILDLDPRFALEENLHLMSDSPCIDAGASALVPLDVFDLDGDLDTSEPIPYDAEGNTRVLDGTIEDPPVEDPVPDMGAYEFDPSAGPVAALSPVAFVFTARQDAGLPEGQTLYVRNRGIGNLDWENEPESQPDWLRVELPDAFPDDDSDPLSLRLYVKEPLPAPGVHSGVVTLHGTDVPVTLYVTRDLHVPSEFGTIQEAIQEAIEGDVVLVQDGTYTGAGNTDLDLLGKAITVRSENGPGQTTIDCNAGASETVRAFKLRWTETPQSIIQGFTMQNCQAAEQAGDVTGEGEGGAVYIGETSSATILDCAFSGNRATRDATSSEGGKGGAIASHGMWVRIANSSFVPSPQADPPVGSNAADGGTSDLIRGGAIYVEGESTTVENCSFKGNEAGRGGAIAFYGDARLGVISGSEFITNTASLSGGAIQVGAASSEREALRVGRSRFFDNSAQLGGAISTDTDARIDNSVFWSNEASSGGAILQFGDAKLEIANSTFHGNWAYGGSNLGGAVSSSNDSLTIINSIFSANFSSTGLDDIEPPGLGGVTYSAIMDGGLGTNAHNIPIEVTDNQFVAPGDFEEADFRLLSTSPCIDRGAKIPWMFSDVRGSLRPVEIPDMPRNASGVPIAQDSAFDMGAYEYSEDYGGLEGDQTTKAFQEVGTGSSLVVTSFGYEVQWKDKDPFAYDSRISHSGEYAVRLALVNDAGVRIELGTHTVQVSQQGYSIPYTFGPEHIGTWRIRVELASDPGQFALSDEISIEYKEATTYYLGQRIPAPAGADSTQEPEVDAEDATYWSVDSKRLFAVRPVTTVITWYEDELREVPIPVVAYITYPSNPQAYIADSPPAELLPEGTRFDLVEEKYASNDAAISGNQFTASLEGWTVLLFRDDQAATLEKERFEVVRTLLWNHADDPDDPDDPTFPFESLATIGSEITDGEHATACGGGHVFFEGARYDGYGEGKAYDRDTREGPIIAVNEDDPGEVEDDPDEVKDDLVVVWYNESLVSDACWPSKPVRYEAAWPTAAKKIVIASQLGSGALSLDQYGPVDAMLIYDQPDREQPGYNPNEEHALFFTPTWSQDPVLFPLRTDLNSPDLDAPEYLAGDRSRPYVLLKYRDPDTADWAFEVFQVVAQSGRYIQFGGIVPFQTGFPDWRYYLNDSGVLTLRSGALPQDSFYLDHRGQLVRYGDPGESWYNLVGGSITPEPLLQNVNTYYLDDATGQLLDQTDSDTGPRYSLDVHGAIVESDTYYRLHYTGTAGQEITRPYPLSQPALGPCSESYTITPTSILEDKDSRFFAKHGGIGGASTEEGRVNYFYRLQPGFFYDLDDNGVPDETVGACVPWLEGLAGAPNPEDPAEPAAVDTTYAITWPDSVPTLHVGETLTDAKTQAGETVGLPNVADQCIVDVLFDESVATSGPAVNLIDPLREYSAPFPPESPPTSALPTSLKPRFPLGTQRYVFDALPQHLKERLTYDPYSGDEGELKLRGTYTTGTGEPLLLLNALTDRDRAAILTLFDENPGDNENKAAFLLVVDDLIGQGDDGLAYHPDPELGYPSLHHAEMKALTAGDAQGIGYVTLAFNDHEDCPAPTMLSVLQVDCPLYVGEIKVIESDNAFDEKLTLRHNGDFGGESDEKWFRWMVLPADFSGIPEGPDSQDESWQSYSPVNIVPPPLGGPEDGFYQGVVDITVVGDGQQLLGDKWFSARYRDPYVPAVCADVTSEWTRPQLYEGWIKRVMKKVNLFDQKVKEFHESDVDTLASMISLAGTAYEGDVALSEDPEYLKTVGIIELYETLLRRGRELTIDSDSPPAPTEQEIHKAILFAANRIAGLGMLLGNEAYADASDPTIGFSTTDGQYGIEAPSIFTFQNQVDSLLEEELALLRGRADEGVRPFYNRLIWNFTLGDGEVAYAESYNITDQDTDQDGDGVPDAPDGLIDERDAMVLFPQGHGDAWGHYLTAIKQYYDLLKHPHFAWEPQTEAILVEQTPVEVDYRDERKFAAAAAARARTGAEIVNLTYRQHYVEDPEGQWQGYKDDDADRAWGVDGWTRRAGQGALFDWVVGNAILPPEDAVHEGIAKVDRTTVVELQEVSSQYAAVQATVDEGDLGLNPLGVAKQSVPFDIDPGGIANGQTHFEQIYDRAVQAMNNAIAVFNHANQSTMLLRRQQDTLAGFKRNIENTEVDLNNRMVEVFGYPYSDDCGPGRTYATEYCQTGPDLYHYMYVDPSELMGVDAPEVHEWIQPMSTITVDDSGVLSTTVEDVPFHVATDSRFGLIKPPAWQGRRKAPGEIQLARSDLLQARGRFDKALVEYDNLLFHIERQAHLIKLHHGLNTEEINILERDKNRQQSLNAAIQDARIRQHYYQTAANVALGIGNALAEGYPGVTGFIAGMANGVIVDSLSPARAAMKNIGVIGSKILNTMADLASFAEVDQQHAKEMVSLESNIELTALRGEFAVEQELLQLENLVHTEATLRLEIYNLAESMQQSAGRYLAALARGDRLLRDRLRFRRQTAAQIQAYRYKDMTFRIFRNDALQKYRAQFDLAARYVYLAAKAYDYETTLLDYQSMAGQAFFTDIVRQRAIGLIEGGMPLTGTGLADPMKRMWQNFQVLKPQLGFNNPQVETNRFSLRREHFRVTMEEGSNQTWRQALEAHRVDDLWDVPEFRRHCRPFAPEGIRQPGIVIPLSTTVTSGLNFFGWPLGGRDSYYSATNFATKVRSVGVWLSNYDHVGLAQTPRVYLIPAGEDVLRTPSYSVQDIRTWQIVDQKLPVPFPIVQTELESNPGWMPMVDTLFDELFQVRRHSDFRAYHDSGYVNESEMTFDSRAVGRSVWNTRWLLIIPGQNLLYDPDEGLDTFIYGPRVIGGDGERTGNGISDIKLFFHTYAYSGN